MTDWNPNDPDAPRVYYDLVAWTFDQQAELSSAMADAEIPHSWEGTELMVPDECEEATDQVIAEVEVRLGIDSGNGDEMAIGDTLLPQRVLPDDVPTTEYDLAAWEATETDALTHALMGAGVAFRWEATVLLVGTDDESVVDALLDEIERGDYADVMSPSAGEGSAETMTHLFLAADRLRNDPLDADGIEHLKQGTGEADPDAPPFGVTPRSWQQIVDAADEVVDALVHEAGPDEEAAMAAAERLHELLRPTV
ncbi:MAG: hypothetical protein WD023_09790 [Ilumatobacteraceae bacterium]